MRSTVDNLWLRRHLLRVLVTSHLKRQSKNSALGYLWWLLDPICLTAVYYIVVAILFKRGGSNQPFILYLLCGLVAWKAFSDSVGQSVGIMMTQAPIIKSISFPKAVLPISVVLSNTVFFFFALAVACGLAVCFGQKYGTWPSLHYLMLPVVVGIQVLFTVGVAFVVSVLGLLFRDTGNIINHLLRMWYFLSPGLYNVDIVPPEYLFTYRLNPFCGLMMSYRAIIMWHRMPAWEDLGWALSTGMTACLVGYLLFRYHEGRLVQRL